MVSLKKPVEMADWQKICQYICWLSETLHTSQEVVQAIENKLQYAGDSVHNSVKRFFLDFAGCGLACVQLCEDARDDYVLIPTVDPHAFSHFLNRRVEEDRKGIRPRVGEQVTFSIWDGNNAPADLAAWSGKIIEQVKGRVVVEYIIVRDADGQKIKLARKYLRDRKTEDKGAIV